jgi:hypothetical protein
MAATVHRPLKVVAFNANGIGRQAYELRKQLQDLKIDGAIFTEIHLKQHMRFYIPNCHIYRNDRLDGNKGGTAVAVKKGIPRTYVDLPPVLSLEATRVSIPIGHTEMLLASVYKSPLRAWRDADITELLNLRTKSIWACDLNAKHLVWNNKVSNPLGLKFLDLCVNCHFEISAQQHQTHFVPNGRGDVLDIVFHKDVRLSEVRAQDITNSDQLPIMFRILDHIKVRDILDPVETFTDLERFQSLASSLVSLRVEINSCIEADKTDRHFAASIVAAYWLSTKTTISDRNVGSYSLERLLKHKQRLRKLWQETRYPACNTAVN